MEGASSAPDPAAGVTVVPRKPRSAYVPGAAPAEAAQVPAAAAATADAPRAPAAGGDLLVAGIIGLLCVYGAYRLGGDLLRGLAGKAASATPPALPAPGAAATAAASAAADTLAAPAL